MVYGYCIGRNEIILLQLKPPKRTEHNPLILNIETRCVSISHFEDLIEYHLTIRFRFEMLNDHDLTTRITEKEFGFFLKDIFLLQSDFPA